MKTVFLALMIYVIVTAAVNGRVGKPRRRPNRPGKPTYFDKWRATTKYSCGYKKMFKEVRNSPHFLNGLQIISKIPGRYSGACHCSQKCHQKLECGAFVLRGKYCILLHTTWPGKNAYIYSTGDRFYAYIGIQLTVLVFRITSGVDGDAIVRYNDNSYVSSDADTILAVDLSVTLNNTYKSALLDRWNTFNVVRVRIGFVQPDNTIGFLTFDGRKSTSKYNWMVQKNLLSSPWYDLTTTTKTVRFGVFGSGTRRFYIMDHRGCARDFLWLAVVLRRDPCGWTAGYKNPEIIYSPLSTGYPVNNRNPGKALTFGIAMVLRMD